MNTRTEQINDTHLDTIDWSRASFPIGVETKDARPWLALSLGELQILHRLLTKPLPLAKKMDDGSVVVTVIEPAMEAGENLGHMVKWLEAAIAWKTANPEK